MIKKISTVVGIIVALFVILGGAWKYDQMKADASELQLVAARLDQKIVNDNIRAVQQRIWDMEMYYKKMGQLIPPEVEQQIVQMKYDIEVMKQQLKKK